MGRQEGEKNSRGGQFPARDRLSLKIELELLWGHGMLLAPELQQFFRQPAAVAEQLVDERVTGRADGDQPAIGVAAGPAVMDHPLSACPTALAAVAVAYEHMLAVTGEVA